ncbi:MULTISPECIES: hypothetical protein [unclassified Lysinibacillus]|uniref:hypothetical protein n=1 Tax=unclassified Lysinibacillus TaxID=2636778 RepID=UPI003828A6F4
MAKVEGITIDVGIGDKTKLRLRAIEKHVGALADELDRIDNMKECLTCGSYKTVTETLTDIEARKAISVIVKCSDCNHEWPTRLEGSD